MFGRFPLAGLYGIYMLIAGGVCVVMTPPFQVPDEPNHFMRALQVAQGGLVGTRISQTESGAYLPESVSRMTALFDSLKFAPDKKVTGDMLNAAFQASWKSPIVFVDFQNTVLYPPTSYIGDVLGIFVGHGLNASPLGTFYLARLGSLIVNVSIGIIALCMAGDAGALLLVLLALPMCVSLEASCSQDGMVIALAALAAACLLKLTENPEKKWEIGILSMATIAFGCMAAAKAPYVALLGLPVLVAPWREWKKVIGLIAGGSAIFLLWVFEGLRKVMTITAPPGASSAGQLQFLIHHHFAFIHVVWVSLWITWRPLFEQTIGVLGWLDTDLPWRFYVISACVVVLFFIWQFAGLKRGVFSAAFWVRFILLLGVLFAVTEGIYLALYITWTAVAAPYVDGVQGRYFLPVCMMLVLCQRFVPKSHTWNQIHQNPWVPVLVRLLLCCFMIYSVCTIYNALSHRYW